MKTTWKHRILSGQSYLSKRSSQYGNFMLACGTNSSIFKDRCVRKSMQQRNPNTRNYTERVTYVYGYCSSTVITMQALPREPLENILSFVACPADITNKPPNPPDRPRPYRSYVVRCVEDSLAKFLRISRSFRVALLHVFQLPPPPDGNGPDACVGWWFT